MEQLDKWLLELDEKIEEYRNFKLPEDYQEVKFIDEEQMELNEYQDKAMATCMPSSDNFAYMMLNLVGEVGELSSKVAKAIRKEKINISGNYISIPTSNMINVGIEIEEEWKNEIGDVAWQLAGLCKVMGWTLEEVCQANLDKLYSRQDRGVIDGNGDNR